MITECDFIEAWSALTSSNVVAISTVTKDKYTLDKANNKLKFFSSTIDNWRSVDYILTKEILGKWIISREE